MTFDQFKELLTEADRRNDSVEVGMFLCNPQDLGNARYSYDFDGHLTCVIEFNPDGSLSEWQDADPADLDNRNRQSWPNTEAWLDAVKLDAMIAELK